MHNIVQSTLSVFASAILLSLLMWLLSNALVPTALTLISESIDIENHAIKLLQIILATSLISIVLLIALVVQSIIYTIKLHKAEDLTKELLQDNSELITETGSLKVEISQLNMQSNINKPNLNL